MRNKLRRIIFAALMLLSFNTIFGQHLAVVGLHGWPDTAYCSVPYSFYIEVKNMDTATFTGNVTINILNDSIRYLDSTFITIPGLSVDTSMHISNYYYNPPSYAAGHDVVIVWPIANYIAIGDSLHDSVFVICTTGIPNIPNEKAFSVFPNPATNILFFDSKYTPNDMEYVRIIDLIGEEQSRIIPNEMAIPINNLSSGMYFIEVKLKDGNIFREKFIRQ